MEEGSRSESLLQLMHDVLPSAEVVGSLLHPRGWHGGRQHQTAWSPLPLRDPVAESMDLAEHPPVPVVQGLLQLHAYSTGTSKEMFSSLLVGPGSGDVGAGDALEDWDRDRDRDADRELDRDRDVEWLGL